MPYSCGCVFARPSANALQPRNHPSGDWAAAVLPNARNDATTNAGTHLAYVISFSPCCSCLVLYHNALSSLVERGAWLRASSRARSGRPTPPAPPPPPPEASLDLRAII